MKRLLYFFAVGLLAFAACNQNGHYRVVVTFPDNASDGDTAYLTSYDSGDTLATGVVKDKLVTLEGEVDGSFMSRLLVAGKRLGFIVENGEISIKMEEGKATGTALNDRMNAIDEELGKVEDDSVMTQMFYKAYQDNKDNGIGPWAFNYYLMYNSFTPEQIDSLLKEAPEGYRNLKRVQKAIKGAQQLAATAIGKKFTDFTAADGTALSKFAGNGKYTLVDFWASWCGPCRREIPNIKKLYEKFSAKMNFVGIAVWDDPADTHKAIENLGIVWPVMEGGKNWTEPTDLYGVSGIPHIMLIDPQGVIVARGLEGESMIKTIEDLKL